jgi:hypothetical protein
VRTVLGPGFRCTSTASGSIEDLAVLVRRDRGPADAPGPHRGHLAAWQLAAHSGHIQTRAEGLQLATTFLPGERQLAVVGEKFKAIDTHMS